MTEMINTAKVELSSPHGLTPNGYVGILELACVQVDGLVIARTMSPVENGLTVVRILNMT